MLFGSGARWALQYAHGFMQLACICGASSLLGGCVNPILDSSAIYTLSQHDIPLESYGKFRVFSAVGWGIAGVGLGELLDQFSILVLFYAFGALSVLYIGVMLTFPVHTDSRNSKKPVEMDEISTSGRGTSSKSLSFCEYFTILLRTGDAPLFLFLQVILGTCQSTIVVFLFLYLQDAHKASHLLLGVTLTVTTVSEFPFFFYSGAMLKYFGAVPVQLLALLAYAGRTFYYSYVEDPWTVLPVELLHGLTFALTWAAVSYNN